MSKIKAVIFDFDGVIVESMDIKARAFAHLFKDYPEYIDQIVKFHLLHGGLSRFEKFKVIYDQMLHQSLSEQKSAELGREFSKFVYQEVIACPFVNGAKQLLDKYYKKMPLFIVSGTPEAEMLSIVKERNLHKYFLEVFGSPKKKAVLNQLILDKYKLKPQEVVFVGDSIDDYEGAFQTGIRFVGRIVKDNVFEGKKLEATILDIFDLEAVINSCGK